MKLWLFDLSTAAVAAVLKDDPGEASNTKDGFTQHTNILSLALSPDDKFLAAGSWTNGIELFDIKNKSRTRRLKGHANAVLSIDFAPDGKLLASGSADQTVKIWNPKTGQLVHTLEPKPAGEVIDVRFSPDGKTLATCSTPRGVSTAAVKLWDPRTGELKDSLDTTGVTFSSYPTGGGRLDFSPDGKFLGAAHSNGVLIWNARTKQLLQSETTAAVLCEIAFSPDSATLAAGGYESDGNSGMKAKIHFWNVRELLTKD